MIQLYGKEKDKKTDPDAAVKVIGEIGNAFEKVADSIADVYKSQIPGETTTEEEEEEEDNGAKVGNWVPVALLGIGGLAAIALITRR